MTDTTDHGQNPSPDPEPVETFYEDEGGAKQSRAADALHQAGDVLCQAASAVGNGVLKALPPDTTRHLVNSHNELLKAGVTLAEAAIARANGVADKARDLHATN